jgi:hypothetical protein
MKERCLVVFSSYNSPWFLETLVDSIQRHDAGYPFDLLILNHSSTDKKQLDLLDKYSKTYRVETRENLGRAQGGYDYAWQNNKDYKYYFFLHDDSIILRDNWLKVIVDSATDASVEPQITNLGLDTLPIGKVGLQGYEWQNKYHYLRTGHRTVFHYMDEIASKLKVTVPNHYQHINDDKVLYTNELLQKMGKIWNIELFRQMKDTEEFKFIDEYFEANYPNRDPFAPNETYGSHYHGFQTTSEFLNDIAAMSHGFRTHIVSGIGYCQEELGFNSFWGNEYIAHMGDHVVFKSLAKRFNIDEQSVRNKFKDKTFLKICSNIIKKETSYVTG